jgi:hypothetical protein
MSRKWGDDEPRDRYEGPFFILDVFGRRVIRLATRSELLSGGYQWYFRYWEITAIVRLARWARKRWRNRR